MSAARSVRRRTVLLPVVDAGRCTGCGWCVAACPEHVLSLEVFAGKKCSVLHDAAHCTGCGKCEVKCPFDAIAMCRTKGDAPAGS